MKSNRCGIYKNDKNNALFYLVQLNVNFRTTANEKSKRIINISNAKGFPRFEQKSEKVLPPFQLELTRMGQKSVLKNGCKKCKEWTSLIIFIEKT